MTFPFLSSSFSLFYITPDRECYTFRGEIAHALYAPTGRRKLHCKTKKRAARVSLSCFLDLPDNGHLPAGLLCQGRCLLGNVRVSLPAPGRSSLFSFPYCLALHTARPSTAQKRQRKRERERREIQYLRSERARARSPGSRILVRTFIFSPPSRRNFSGYCRSHRAHNIDPRYIPCVAARPTSGRALSDTRQLSPTGRIASAGISRCFFFCLFTVRSQFCEIFGYGCAIGWHPMLDFEGFDVAMLHASIVYVVAE